MSNHNLNEITEAIQAGAAYLETFLDRQTIVSYDRRSQGIWKGGTL